MDTISKFDSNVIGSYGRYPLVMEAGSERICKDENGREYIDILRKINSGSGQPVYAMPILESSAIADGATRISQLTAIRELLLSAKEYILNVRVGGNDFCNLYGLRRSVNQTIYDVGVVRDILVDIVNVFARDFVVSGPVWEYFENDKNDKWAAGLKKELEFDRINGFISFAGILFIEGDKIILNELDLDFNEIEMLEHIVLQMEKESGLDRSAAIAKMRFSFINRVCKQTVVKPRESKEHSRSQKIDKILTGKYTAIPAFISLWQVKIQLKESEKKAELEREANQKQKEVINSAASLICSITFSLFVTCIVL